MQFLEFNQQKGSSINLPAHGWVGVRARNLAAHFALQNTNSVGVQSEGEAEGGCGGNSASPEPKRSPAALLVQSRVQQKSFLFLLEEKNGAHKSKNVKKTFLLDSERSERRRGGASTFAIWIFFKKSSDFNQKVPPVFRIRILGDCCLAPPKAGLGFSKDFEGIFEIQKQFLPTQTEVRRAKHGQNEVLQTNLFSFAFGERQSDNFKYFDCLITKTI